MTVWARLAVNAAMRRLFYYPKLSRNRLKDIKASIARLDGVPKNTLIFGEKEKASESCDFCGKQKRI